MVPKSRHCPGSHQTVNQQPSSLPSVIRQVSTTCPSLTNHAVASSPDCPGSTYPPAVPQSSPAFLLSFPPRVPTIWRLPKASRRQAAEKFSALLEGVVRDNTPSSWVSLLLFTSNCLYSLRRWGRRWSLATVINKQLEDFSGRPGALPAS